MNKLTIKGGLLATALLASQSVFALPTLQLDALGGYYDSSSEDSVSSASSFSLRALLCDQSSNGDCRNVTPDTYTGYFISIAIERDDGASVGGDTNFGSFSFGGTTFNSGNTFYGIPPQGPEDDLARHGIYPTAFGQFGFSFNPSQTMGGYDVVDCAPELNAGCNTTGSVFYRDFAVDLAGLLDGFDLHFDLYHVNASGDIDRFAPFSHDASTTTQVPEPGSLMLLTAGLLGLVATRRFTAKS